MCDVSGAGAESKQHNNNENGCCNDSTSANDSIEATQLSEQVLEAYATLATKKGISAYELIVRPIGGVGENSYGSVFQVKLTPTAVAGSPPPLCTVLKVAPENAARRAQMKVVDFYAREVFMYERVFAAFRQLESDNAASKEAQEAIRLFDVVPQMYHASLVNEQEFLIFEDLLEQEFQQNSRSKMPNYDIVASSLRALARLHASSFVLQAQQPQTFAELTRDMRDNLFTDDMLVVSLEFGKTYVRRTRTMFEEERRSNGVARRNSAIASQYMPLLQKIEQHFKSITLRCVDGAANAPYAVICHGDFWNNNILYQFDVHDKATTAKLIDFQMSRYSPPVLDLVHYLFACTEKNLRDAHFNDFLAIYYDTLSKHLQHFALDAANIYPKAIFEQQLSQFGVYGLCMSAFAIPFFISNTSELYDLDEITQAMQEMSTSASENSSDGEDIMPDNDVQLQHDKLIKSSDDVEAEKCRDFVEENYLLNERTEPIFKQRMFGIVADLVKYDMAKDIMKL